MKYFFKELAKMVLKCEARLALARRRPRIVAITGSVGKTSAKDAVACALAPFFSVRKSEKSYNSDFGIPLTILGLKNAVRNPVWWCRNLLLGGARALKPERGLNWLVLEVGAGEPGDIKKFAQMLSPDIAVITRFPDVPVHVEYFSSPEAVIAEKTELVRAVREGGTLILNADDAKVRALQTQFPDKKAVLFGTGEHADVRGSDYAVIYRGEGVEKFPAGIRFPVTVLGEMYPIELKGILGEHLILPVLAAFGVAVALKLDLSRVAQAFNKDFVPPDGRMNLIDGVNGLLIIDDSYNASPAAMREALSTLGLLSVSGRKVAILGTMAELGQFSREEHRKAAELAVKSCDKLILVGELWKAIDSHPRLQHVATSREAGEALLRDIRAGDVVLVKGSQSARMERVVKALMREPKRAKELLVRQQDEWQDR